MKRVLFVDHVDRILGGAEINLVELLAEVVQRKKWTAACACPQGSRLSKALEQIGVAQHDYRLPEAANQFRVVGRRFSLANSLAGLRALSKAAQDLGTIRREFRADAVISCTNKDHFAAVSTCTSNPAAKSIWWVNDILSPDFFSKPARMAFVFKSRRASKLVVVSEFARRALICEGVPEGRVAVVHNGIPVQGYVNGVRSSWRRANQLPEDEPLAGIVGRFTAWKGQDFFLKLAAAYLKERPKGHFVLVGQAFNEDQPYEAALRKFVSSHCLGSRVHFVPFQENVGTVLASLNVLIHASTRPEPFGRVIIEAMAAGVPVIAASAGGVPEIIRDGENGLLAAPADLNGYLAQLEKLLGSVALAKRLADAGRKTVNEQFTVGRVCEQFEQIVSTAV